MYKVININLGGRIFHLEENAYEALSNYINSLKQYFGNQPEGVEIVADIEHRIAELLQNKLIAGKINCNLEDVSEIIASIGSPKDIAGDESSDASAFENKTEQADFNRNKNTWSKIYRDPDGKVISGVCSGLGYYFDMDSTIVRLIFIALFFAGGTSVFIYIILWIVIPEAKTTAEKLAMRKEKINIDTIRKSVEEEFGKIKGTIENADVKYRVSGFFQKIFHVIGLIIKAFFKLFGIMIGVMFAIVAVSLFIGMISIITGTTIMNGQHISIFDPFYIHFFENANDRLLSQVAMVLGLFSLVLIFFNVSRSLLTPEKHYASRKFLNRITFTLFVLALILSVISVAKTVSYFHSEASVEQKVQLDSYMTHFTIKTFKSKHRGSGFYVENDTLKIRDIELKVEVTEGRAELVQVIESRGQDFNKAKVNAANCMYDLQIKDSVITLPESFFLKNNQAYRKQKITFILRLPVGTKFTIDRNIHLDVISNTDNDEEIEKGEIYQMKSDGFHCQDCKSVKNFASIERNDYDFNYPTGVFNEIHISSRLKIKMMKGDYTKVMAKGIDDKSDLVVSSDNNGLDIHLRHTLFSEFDNDVEVIVVTPNLKYIKIEGAVHAEIEGFDNQEMEIYCSGTSSCDAIISAVNLIAEVKGASELNLKGKVTHLELDVEGASKLTANDLMAQDVKIEVSGASNAEVYASHSIKARAYGASNIYYYGNPGTTDCTSAGAGIIIKKD